MRSDLGRSPEANPGNVATSAPLVLAVVVNWNGRDMLLECLASLASVEYQKDRLRVLVVDNGSRDGSPEAVHQMYPGVTVTENAHNQGYVKAVNQGVGEGLALGADYLWVLNNDVVVAPDSLKHMVEVAQEDEGIGVVSPVIHSYDEPERVTHVGYAISYWTGRMRRLVAGQDVFVAPDDVVAQVDSSLGCANLIRRRAFEKVGLFRPIYEIYFEETDFNVRARRAGFRVVMVKRAKALHRNAATMNRHLLRRAWLLARNLFIFEVLNARPGHLMVFIPYYFGVHLPGFLLRGGWYGLTLKLSGGR